MYRLRLKTNTVFVCIYALVRLVSFAQAACADPAAGSVILLENLRFHVSSRASTVVRFCTPASLEDLCLSRRSGHIATLQDSLWIMWSTQGCGLSMPLAFVEIWIFGYLGGGRRKGRGCWRRAMPIPLTCTERISSMSCWPNSSESSPTATCSDSSFCPEQIRQQDQSWEGQSCCLPCVHQAAETSPEVLCYVTLKLKIVGQIWDARGWQNFHVSWFWEKQQGPGLLD